MPKIRVVIINIPLTADNLKMLVFNLCKNGKLYDFHYCKQVKNMVI